MNNEHNEVEYASPRDILNIRAKRAYNDAIKRGKSRLSALVFAGKVLHCYNYVPAVVADALRRL